MRKELIIAIIVGVTIGAAIAFGVWRANWALNNNGSSPSQATKEDKVSEVSIKNQIISIAAPEQFSIITKDKTVVSGITSQNSYVFISGENNDYVTKTDDGSFDTEVLLVGGINQIIVSKLSSDEKLAKSILTLVFSSEFESSNQSSSENNNGNTATGSNEIRDKVREKVEALRNNPKAHIGTITDITKDTLQIKIPSGEILFASVNTEETTFAKTNKDTSSIKFDDLAIGDFVIAMGYIENSNLNTDNTSNNVLNTKRVVVTSPLNEPSRNIAVGEVISNSKNILIIKDKEGKEISFTFPKRWNGPEIKEIEEGIKVVIFSTVENEKESIRTIEILSQ